MLPRSPRPDGGHGPHPHRSWLHLIPARRNQEPHPGLQETARTVLVESGLAVLGSGGGLAPGPEFLRSLGGRAGSLPLASSGPARGEVRVQVGTWRCYPDPGPQGFESEPVRSYRAGCPGCGGRLDLFLLAFPFADPLAAACPHCSRELSLLELAFEPELPAARFEITFGDLERRASLAGHPAYPELTSRLGFPLREVHVTL